MKTPLTKAIFTLLLAVAAAPCFAQQSGTVLFSYDANGNRTMRTFSFQKGRCGSDNQEDPTVSQAELMSATATDELAGYELTFYPNPTDGHFSVGADNAGNGTLLQAALYTSKGTLLSRKTLTGDRIDFDLSGHAAGVYLLRLEAGDESRTWKVIKH